MGSEFIDEGVLNDWFNAATSDKGGARPVVFLDGDCIPGGLQCIVAFNDPESNRIIVESLTVATRSNSVRVSLGVRNESTCPWELSFKGRAERKQLKFKGIEGQNPFHTFNVVAKLTRVHYPLDEEAICLDVFAQVVETSNAEDERLVGTVEFRNHERSESLSEKFQLIVDSGR